MGSRNKLGRCNACGEYWCSCEGGDAHTLAVLRKLRETIEGIRIEGYNSIYDFTTAVDIAIKAEEEGGGK